jgi:predicted amidophosphoribosyltransferase
MDSLISYCPNCWIEIGPQDSVCPNCGFRMAAFDTLGYEGKLLLALKHPITENRTLAIQLLGEIKSRSAVSAFATLLDEEEDPYILRAITCALARIGGDPARAVLSRLISHPSGLVRQTAEDARHALTDDDSENNHEQSIS